MFLVTLLTSVLILILLSNNSLKFSIASTSRFRWCSYFIIWCRTFCQIWCCLQILNSFFNCAAMNSWENNSKNTRLRRMSYIILSYCLEPVFIRNQRAFQQWRLWNTTLTNKSTHFIYEAREYPYIKKKLDTFNEMLWTGPKEDKPCDEKWKILLRASLQVQLRSPPCIEW